MTYAGMMLHCGFVDKESFASQTTRSDEFARVVKKAKMIMEESYETSMRKTGGAGNIFALKQYGWSDKHEMKLDPIIVNISGRDAKL